MAQNELFNHEIISTFKSAQDAQIIQSVEVGQTDCLNELVFFFKPEVLAVEDDQKIANSLNLVQEKFNQFDVKVCGAAIIPGKSLEKYEIMNRHYGFINQLSRMASKMVDDETRAEIFEILGKIDTGNYRIMGGHEFLNHFKVEISSLAEIWSGDDSIKLRSGFYLLDVIFHDEPLIIINGFHPKQLIHFTKEDHRIYLMLLHTDTDWHAMKFDLVGDTFPEKAAEGSIRNIMYNSPETFGLREVNIGANCVHLSAGPFEAAFEVNNFFGSLLDLDATKTPPLAVKNAHKSSLSLEKALGLMENPTHNDQDLFTESENLNTDSAVKLAHDWFS